MRSKERQSFITTEELVSAAAVPYRRMVKSLCVVWLVAVFFGWASADAQMTLTSAVDLALRNNPRMKMAEDDLHKAEAALSETKDAYVPGIAGSSGLGASSGITLNVPTVFTISAQSLVFNGSQRDYLRAARYDVQSSQLALKDVRAQIEEDTVVTYLSLDTALQRQAVMADQYRAAVKLQSVVEDRFNAGIENEMDMKNAHRTAVEVRLRQLQLEDEVISLRDHLARLTGVPAEQIVIASARPPSDAPRIPTSSIASSVYPDTPNILSASLNAQSKLQRAFGDSRSTWMPQVTFDAQYGRISPFNNVSSYYNLNGNYNTLAVGIQIQIPFLDKSRDAKARESMADAMHAVHELDFLRNQEGENRLKLQHSVAELTAKAELAEIDNGIAQDRLHAILIKENTTGSSGAVPTMTPKDEQTARIEERQKYLDLLEANLNLRKAQINILKQTGELEDWIKSSCTPEP